MANCSAPAKVSSGVPQGTVPGPLMFLIYISDIWDGRYSNLRLSAHDSLLYLAIETPNDAAQRQNDFRKNCHSGQPSGRLSFNPDKCKVLTVRLGNRTQFSIQYEINSKKTLEALESHPYLARYAWLLLTPHRTISLNWNKHVENVIVRANRSLGFVKRNLRRCSERVKVQAYSTLSVHIWSTPVLYGRHIKSTRSIVQRLYSARRLTSARTAGKDNRGQWLVWSRNLNESLYRWDEKEEGWCCSPRYSGVWWLSRCHNMSNHHITAEPVSNIPSCQIHCVNCGSNEYKGSFFPATINFWNSLWPGKFFIWIDLSIYLSRSCLFCIIIIIFVSYGHMHVMAMVLWIIWINLNVNVKASSFFLSLKLLFFSSWTGICFFFQWNYILTFQGVVNIFAQCDYKPWFFLPSRKLSSKCLKTRLCVVNSSRIVTSVWPWLSPRTLVTLLG